MKPNILLDTDSYKVTHWKQYPPKTEKVYSYFESRGGPFEEIVFFGLQYIIFHHLMHTSGLVYTLNEAQKFYTEHFANESLFNKRGWEYIFHKYPGGGLPLEIYALPEGSVTKPGDPLITIVNTDEKVPWLTNWMETIISQIWYPCTVATYSRECKKVIREFLEKTGTPSLIEYKLHDFGFRGATSLESAAIGSASHLVNFLGTDTLAGIRLLKEYYYPHEMPGHSIPASEHSTITSWGKDKEVDAFQNMLFQYPTGNVACVSDSYDIFKACSELWGEDLRDLILDRDGTLIVRPDSGDPAATVMGVLVRLGEKFGYTKNEKGYKLLHPNIRVIQGDGINLNEIRWILSTMQIGGWSADNIAFGSGGALLQDHTRDTCKFAFKCSAIKVDGTWKDVYKDPITDPGKKSQRGRFDPEKHGLELMYKNGPTISPELFEKIRERASL